MIVVLFRSELQRVLGDNLDVHGYCYQEDTITRFPYNQRRAGKEVWFIRSVDCVRGRP